MAPTPALTADQRRWIAEEEQLAHSAVEAIAHARRDQPLPDPRAPYFAHLRLRVGQRTRDLQQLWIMSIGPMSRLVAEPGCLDDG